MKIARTLLLILISIPALAQAPGEDRVMGWFRAFNSGSAETMEAFVRANYTPAAQQRRTPEERKAIYDQLRAAHGNLEPADVVTSPEGLNVDVKPERGERLGFRFTIDSAPPHLLGGVGIFAGGGREPAAQLPPLSIPKNATREQIAAALEPYIRNFAARDEFAGSVLVAKNGEVLFENAYGLASRRYGAPNKITTRFNVGSITKSFTKTAVAQLVEAGKLELDAPVITYLPNYPNKEVARKITVRQLVDHTSGLGDIFTKRFWETNTMRFRTLRDFIDFFAGDPLQFEPGKGKQYSNYGYVVLGAVIEAASGEDYFDYIQKHVFDAAAMRGSGFFDVRKPVPDVALGHTRNLPDGGKSNEWLETRSAFERGVPAGASFSPVRDLLLFDRALRAGKLVNEHGTRWYFGGDPNGTDIYAGGLPGVNGAVASDGTWTVVVLTNIDPPTGENLAEHIYGVLTR